MLLNAFYQTGEPGVTALSRSAVVVCNEDSEEFWWNLDKGVHSVTIKAKQNCAQDLSAKVRVKCILKIRLFIEMTQYAVGVYCIHVYIWRLLRVACKSGLLLPVCIDDAILQV